jgi:site-specific DNA-cytosine methylase
MFHTCVLQLLRPSQEINPRCQHILRDNHLWCNDVKCVRSPIPCVFADMTEMVQHGSYSASSCFLAKYHDVQAAHLQGSQMCITHQALCRIPDVDLEPAGLPCQDQSAAGLQLYEEGPTSIIFIIWAKRHILKRTPLLILENTPVAKPSN